MERSAGAKLELRRSQGVGSLSKDCMPGCAPPCVRVCRCPTVSACKLAWHRNVVADEATGRRTKRGLRSSQFEGQWSETNWERAMARREGPCLSDGEPQEESGTPRNKEMEEAESWE